MAAVIATWVLFDTKRGAIEALAPIGGGAVVLYAALYASESLRHTIGRSKAQNAFSILSRFDEEDFLKTRTFVEKHLEENHLGGKEINDLLENYPISRRRLRALLGYFEDMALAIETRHADELILFRSMRGVLVNHVGCLRPYIEYQQNIKNDDKIFCESIRLCNAWSENKSLIDGELLINEG